MIKPQQVDLNMHMNLPAIHHAYCSFTPWVRAASVSTQSLVEHIVQAMNNA